MNGQDKFSLNEEKLNKVLDTIEASEFDFECLLSGKREANWIKLSHEVIFKSDKGDEIIFYLSNKSKELIGFYIRCPNEEFRLSAHLAHCNQSINDQTTDIWSKFRAHYRLDLKLLFL